jgi:hypothetical protein
MDPVWLPVFVLLLMAMGAGISGISFLRSGQRAHALKAWIVCFGCAALVYLSSQLTPKAGPLPELLPAHEESISVVLGGVVLRLDPAPTYMFAVGGEEFLTVSTRRSALRISGVVGEEDRPLAKVSENTFPARRGAHLRPGRSEHAIWVNEQGRRIFEAEFDDPGTIEITGEFFGSMNERASLISCRDGVHWGGGKLPAGYVVDLRGQKGSRVDFDRSGVIRFLN